MFIVTVFEAFISHFLSKYFAGRTFFKNKNTFGGFVKEISKKFLNSFSSKTTALCLFKTNAKKYLKEGSEEKICIDELYIFLKVFKSLM